MVYVNTILRVGVEVERVIKKCKNEQLKKLNWTIPGIQETKCRGVEWMVVAVKNQHECNTRQIIE